MRSRTWVVLWALALACAAPRLALAGPGEGEATAPEGATILTFKDGRRIPLLSAKSADLPVARVDTETIALRELGAALASSHEGHAGGAAGRKDILAVLDRIIDARLVVLEARAMGLDGLPEYRKSLESFESNTLRDMVKARLTAGVKPDPERVERMYRDAVREWQVQSIVFKGEEEAHGFATAVLAGGSFEEMARRAIEEKRAEGTGKVESLPEGKMLPEVLGQVRLLLPGAVSKPIKLPGGFAVVRLVGERIPERPEERAKASAAVRSSMETVVLQREYRKLLRKHATVDRALFRKVDLEAKVPGFEVLMKDRRPLVRVPGEAPVTVGDLATEVRLKYFHGVDRAAREGKLNVKKEDALEQVLARRLFLREARLRKLHQTPEFRFLSQDFDREVLFGLAVKRALIPDIQVGEAEERAYYDGHRADFTYPRFLRMDGIAFGSAGAAAEALKKLKAGTEFKWYAANASGRLDRERATLQFSPMPVSAAELSPGLARSLAGATTGDYRLHAEGDEHYVIQVVEEIPPKVQPFEEAQGVVRGRVFGEKLSQALGDWVRKLRASYPVEVFAARIGD